LLYRNFSRSGRGHCAAKKVAQSAAELGDHHASWVNLHFVIINKFQLQKSFWNYLQKHILAIDCRVKVA